MTVRSAHGGRLALVGTGLALCYTVQQSAMPVLLQLAVRLGLDEVRMGVVVTASGCAFLLSNPLWTFLSHRTGTRPLLLGGLIGVLLSALAFAAVVHWPPETARAAFALALLTRGMLFGLALAAVAVSSAAYLLADAEQRGRAATVIAAAPGIGIVAGPLLDTATGSRGLLVLLLVPLVLLALTTSLLVRLPPGVRQGPAERGTWQWGPFLRSGWPHLLVVVSLLLLVAATQVNIGFLLRDRIGVPADEAGQSAAWVLVAGGAAFLLTQAVAVARPTLLGTWSLRAGVLITLLGVLPLAFGRVCLGSCSGPWSQPWGWASRCPLATNVCRSPPVMPGRPRPEAPSRPPRAWPSPSARSWQPDCTLPAPPRRSCSLPVCCSLVSPAHWQRGHEFADTAACVGDQAGVTTGHPSAEARRSSIGGVSACSRCWKPGYRSCLWGLRGHGTRMWTLMSTEQRSQNPAAASDLDGVGGTDQ